MLFISSTNKILNKSVLKFNRIQLKKGALYHVIQHPTIDSVEIGSDFNRIIQWTNERNLCKFPCWMRYQSSRIDWIRAQIVRIIDISGSGSYKKFIKGSGAQTGGNKLFCRDERERYLSPGVWLTAADEKLKLCEIKLPNCRCSADQTMWRQQRYIFFELLARRLN